METRWFIKPLGSYISANEEIARILNKLGVAFESEHYNLIDEKGVRHLFMWGVDHQIIQALNDNKLTFNFRFRIFNREGRSGKLREWKFPAKKKSAKARKAVADLKKLRNKQQKGAA